MTPQVRYHIALCEEKLGRLVAALGGFELALAEADSVGDDFRTEVQGAVDALRNKIPMLTIERGPGADAATIEVDNVALGAASVGQPFPVDPGPHAISAKSPGFKDFIGVVELDDAERRTFVVQLEPRETAPTSRPIASASTFPDDIAVAKRSRIVPYVVGGVGVAALVTSGRSSGCDRARSAIWKMPATARTATPAAKPTGDKLTTYHYGSQVALDRHRRRGHGGGLDPPRAEAQSAARRWGALRSGALDPERRLELHRERSESTVALRPSDSVSSIGAASPPRPASRPAGAPPRGVADGPHGRSPATPFAHRGGTRRPAPRSQFGGAPIHAASPVRRRAGRFATVRFSLLHRGGTRRPAPRKVNSRGAPPHAASLVSAPATVALATGSAAALSYDRRARWRARRSRPGRTPCRTWPDRASSPGRTDSERRGSRGSHGTRTPQPGLAGDVGDEAAQLPSSLASRYTDRSAARRASTQPPSSSSTREPPHATPNATVTAITHARWSQRPAERTLFTHTPRGRSFARSRWPE